MTSITISVERFRVILDNIPQKYDYVGRSTLENWESIWKTASYLEASSITLDISDAVLLVHLSKIYNK